MALTVSYGETIAIESFLRYLSNNYSRKIATTDTYLIAAVAAFFYAETSGGKDYKYNNPFKLKSSTGTLLRFSTLSNGFIAAAKALIKGAPYKSSGYQLALNALKNGGNQAAVDFLAALSQSQWDAMGFGANDWIDAYNADKNKLLGIYTKIGGIQLQNPTRPKPKPVRRPPVLPADYNYRVVDRPYLDPWAASSLYAARRGRGTLHSVDTSHRRG